MTTQTWPPTAGHSAAVVLRTGELSPDELARHMQRLGYPQATTVTVQALLREDPERFTERDGRWSLAVPSPRTGAAAKPALSPVDTSRQQRRPYTGYPSPGFSFSNLGLKSGRLPDGLTFPIAERRLAEQLRFGSYRSVSLRRDPGEVTPSWAVHVTRLLEDDQMWFVAVSYAASEKRVERLAALGWDLWAPAGPVDWRDDRLLLDPSTHPGAALGTWRSDTAKAATGAVMQLVHTGMGTRRLDAVTVDIQQLPPQDIILRAASAPVRRAVRAMTRPQGPVLGTCQWCHRPLTDPASAERGYGPDCWEKLMDSRAARGWTGPRHNLAEFVAGAYMFAEWPDALAELVAGDRLAAEPGAGEGQQ